MYHIHADKTFGALVERYCLGSKTCSAIGIYAVPKTRSTIDIEHCTERIDMKVVAAWRRFSSLRAPNAGFGEVVERIFEK